MHKIIIGCVACGLMVSATNAEDLKLPTAVCIDQDELAKFLIAGVSGLQPAVACEYVARGRAEIIQAFPSGSDIGRVVKVRVTRPEKAPIEGFAIQIN
jgi:hypothetical protein